MPVFVPDKPIETPDPTVTVEFERGKPLPPGKYRFQLTIVDDQGNSSKAVTATIVIEASSKTPVAVLEAPTRVAFGQTFNLVGDASFAVPPATIKAYQWTLLVD